MSADDAPAPSSEAKPSSETKPSSEAKPSSETTSKSTEDAPAKPRSKTPLIIMAAVVLLAAVVAFFVWLAHRNQVSTDDAYTDGNTVTIAPKVSGYVTELLVDDNTHIHRGDLLVRIDAGDFKTSQAQAAAELGLARAELDAAQAQLKIAEVQYPAQLVSAKAQRDSAAAALAQAKAQYQREHEVDLRATTQQNIDVATSQRSTAEGNLRQAEAQVAIASLVPQHLAEARTSVAQRQAQVDQSQARLDQANLNVGYAEIRSPVDGFVTMRSVQLGSYLAAGQAMFFIVTPDVWVTANFKESQIGRMREGDAVDLLIDAYSSLKLHGHVQSIQYGSGSKFSAFPAENATGNFVKIVQRIPVKIVVDTGLDPARPLPLGLSVTPTVHFP